MVPRRASIPGFRVLRPLGTGGMGSVLLVEPEALPGVTRALKVVAVGDAERRARFLREAELLARVDHCPGVVRVHGAGEHEGLLWVCMEHVDGEDLGQALGRRGPLPWEDTLRLGRELALGLAEVHARGVVHRDVKPANVVVDRAGAPHLVDFGVAQATDLERLTLSGTAMGTPAYFSPEQTSGRPVDGKSDVYSLGVTLYEVLTGTVPFSDGVPLPDLVRAIVHTPPEPPSAHRRELPPVVDRTLLAALEKDPARRPDARAFAAMLDACLTGPRGATTSERLVRLAGTARSRRRVALAGAAAGLAVAALAGGGALLATPDAVRTTTTTTTTPSPMVSTTSAAAPPRVSARPAVTGPLAELVALLERGEALRALGWLHARRDAAGAERRALVAHAPAVEELARARTIQALADPAASPELADTLAQVVLRLRDLAPEPERLDGAELADAALRALGAEARAARARAPVGARAPDGRLEGRIRILRSVAAAGVRAADRVGGEVAADDLLLAFADGLVTDELYVRALEALVALDVDLEWGHLAKARILPGEGTPSPAADYVRLRTEVALDPTALKVVARRLLLELVTSERGRALGPLTRARGLCVGQADGVATAEMLGRAREAIALDPRSPFPRLVLAQVLAMNGDAAFDVHRAEIERLVEAGLASFEAHHARRPSTTAWDHAMVLRAGVRLYTKLGREDEARALIDRVRAVPGSMPRWGDELEELMRTESASRAPR